MVEIVSLVISTVSLSGALVSTAFTAWVNFFSERKKRTEETRKLVTKYRGHFLLASKDLYMRLFDIADNHLLSVYGTDEHGQHQRDYITNYTAFLLGQYFSWVYILRRQAQDLRFLTNNNKSKNRKFIDTLNKIQEMLSSNNNGHHRNEEIFSLWRAEQVIIGEVMTVQQDNQFACMGYVKFSEKLNADSTFKNWFKPITDDIPKLAKLYSENGTCPAPKLRRLQHLLMDLMHLLEPDPLDLKAHEPRRVTAAPSCRCTACITKVETAQDPPAPQQQQPPPPKQ